jgi:hypothetical protein
MNRFAVAALCVMAQDLLAGMRRQIGGHHGAGDLILDGELEGYGKVLLDQLQAMARPLGP